MEFKNEVWKDIEGFEGLYQVSNYGRIKSLHARKGTGKLIMKPKNSRGYQVIKLAGRNGKKFFSIHRLVAKTFMPNPHNLPCVNHKNENKADNRVENLEWCSVRYNNMFGTRTKRVKEKVAKPILQYDLNGNFIKRHESICDAGKELNISIGNISQCLHKRYKQANGYVFMYESEVV